MNVKKRLLDQDIAPLSQSTDRAQKGTPNTTATTARMTSDLTFEELLPAELTGRFRAIPAEFVSLHAIELPFRSLKQRHAALPFALEDAVGRALEHTHFAICGMTHAGKTLAAAVSMETIVEWTASTNDVALVPEQMLLPPAVANVEKPEVWRAYRQQDRVLVRASDGTGFACRSDVLTSLWHASQQPHVESYGMALPLDMQWSDLSQDGAPPPDTLLSCDLRQGRFQPSRGLVRPLKWLCAFVAIAALAHLAIMALDTRAQRNIADSLQRQAAQALALRLPNASANDRPDVIQRQLSAQNAPQRGSSFLPLFESVSQVLVGQQTAIEFRQLNWADDTLRLSIEAADLDDLQQTEARLTASGLRVTSGSATVADGAARAELTVRP